MKKLLAIATLCVAASGVAFSQTIDWGSVSFAYITAQTNTAGSPLLGGTGSGGTSGKVQGSTTLGTGYYFELLVGSVWNGSAEAAPTTIGQLATWTDSGLECSNNPTSAGRFYTMNNNSATVNANFSSSVSNSIILVGWSANLGSTWSSALSKLQTLSGWTGAAFVGITSVGYIEANPSSSAGNSPFGSAATTYGLPISSLNTQLYQVVPEPGTLALAALGGASLLLFRRKK